MSFTGVALSTQNWVTQHIVLPLLILFLGVFVGKVLEQTLVFLFGEFKCTDQKYLVIANVVKWFVYVATIVVVVYSTGLLVYVLWFVAGVVVALFIIRVLLSLRDFFPNFFSYHTVKAKYKPGASIKTKFVEGKVVQVHLFDVHVRTAEGDDVFIPNRTLRKH
jgi:small-conductance mechanosensitive channel